MLKCSDAAAALGGGVVVVVVASAAVFITITHLAGVITKSSLCPFFPRHHDFQTRIDIVKFIRNVIW